jgi:hypothetical protein
MSAKLYEKCTVCEGAGSVGGDLRIIVDPPGALTPVPLGDGRYRCPSCRGERYIATGMTVGQLEAMRAKAEKFDDMLRVQAQAQRR